MARFVLGLLAVFVAGIVSAVAQPNIITTVGNPSAYCLSAGLSAGQSGNCDSCLNANNASVVGQGFLCVWCQTPLGGGDSSCLSANITSAAAITVLENCPNLNFNLLTCALTVQAFVIIIAVACLVVLLLCATCIGVCICCCVKSCLS